MAYGIFGIFERTGDEMNGAREEGTTGVTKQMIMEETESTEAH